MGGGANPPDGAPTYEFARFSQKLHEIKKILGRSRGCAPGVTPPSLRSATAGKQSEAEGESAGAHTLCSQPSRDTI